MYIIVSKINLLITFKGKSLTLIFIFHTFTLLAKPNWNERENLETFARKIISRSAIPYLTANLCFSNLITKPSAGYLFLVHVTHN